jgi:hypothetical protein
MLQAGKVAGSRPRGSEYICFNLPNPLVALAAVYLASNRKEHQKQKNGVSGEHNAAGA